MPAVGYSPSGSKCGEEQATISQLLTMKWNEEIRNHFIFDHRNKTTLWIPFFF